nr:MAG TPA: hypothetical protein [Caudoviricetes sp.]
MQSKLFLYIFPLYRNIFLDTVIFLLYNVN